MEINPDKLLKKVINMEVSDLHLTVGLPPMVRDARSLKPLPGTSQLDNAEIKEFVNELINERQQKELQENRVLDFSFSYGEEARFRANAYYSKGKLACAFRIIPYEIPTFDELNLPKALSEFGKLPQGLVLVTGATGQGKSTTLASLINYINKNRNLHIMTIEDPIEYVFNHDKSIIHQREMNQDTYSWNDSLKYVLRQDPDVVLVGEMRDYETISSVVTVAETGHLVFSTLHTNSASESINRLLDVFPDNQQAQVRAQLADSLQGIISQKLIQKAEGEGLVPAVEVLIANNAVRNTIREGKAHLINNIISTNLDRGMITLERSLANLVNEGEITKEAALANTLKPDEVERLLRGN